MKLNCLSKPAVALTVAAAASSSSAMRLPPRIGCLSVAPEPLLAPLALKTPGKT